MPTKNAPSRWRPRPTFRLTTAEATTTRRAINLRHSVLGASGTLGTGRQPVKHHLDRIHRNLRIWAPTPRIAGRTLRPSPSDAGPDSVPDRPRSRGGGSSKTRGDLLRDRRRRPRGACATGPRRNAPSRLRLRPAFRLTAAEAAADRRAINLGRSVLGASRTLGRRNRLVKKSGSEDLAICGIFFSHRVELRLKPHALVWRGQKKAGYAGPGRKDSPSRERFRPPSRRTFRFRVVLLGGLRPTGAPCSAQAETYDTGPVRSRGFGAQSSRNLR